MITVLFSDGLGTTFPKSSDGRRNRGSDWRGGWEPWLKETLENASWRLLVENRLADWFSSKKVRVSYSIHWILLLKHDFLQDFWDVCQDLQQNPPYGNFLMQNGSMSMYCISKKPCAWLSAKRGINAVASHIGQQKTIKPASGRQCIARETQCLSWWLKFHPSSWNCLEFL